ncbi:hypothetical protein PSP6_90015 [Paraburkholderia tropica]|nr:hypothetical protein PSP6_90015 [Paraburkholderia tropica]
MHSLGDVTRGKKWVANASPSSSAVLRGQLTRLPYKTANQVPIRSAPHVLPSQAPRACHGLAAVTLGGAYAAVPVRRVYPARLNAAHRVRWRHVGSGQAAGDRLRQT